MHSPQTEEPPSVQNCDPVPAEKAVSCDSAHTCVLFCCGLIHECKQIHQPAIMAGLHRCHQQREWLFAKLPSNQAFIRRLFLSKHG